MIDIYGSTGFIGRAIQLRLGGRCCAVPRDQLRGAASEAIYLISTTHNYHIFDDPHRDVRVNLTHLLNVLDAFRLGGGTVFNFISSWFVYGPGAPLPANENAPCRPLGLYAVTKHCAEGVVITYCLTYGLNYRILRLANVYGPGDFSFSPKKNALTFLWNELLNERPVQLYEDGNFVRDLIYIDDCAAAIDAITSREDTLNLTVNIGSGVPVKFRDLILAAAKLAGADPALIQSRAPSDFHRRVGIRDMVLDVSRMHLHGFRTTTPLGAGIAATLSWLRSRLLKTDVPPASA